MLKPCELFSAHAGYGPNLVDFVITSYNESRMAVMMVFFTPLSTSQSIKVVIMTKTTEVCPWQLAIREPGKSCVIKESAERRKLATYCFHEREGQPSDTSAKGWHSKVIL